MMSTWKWIFFHSLFCSSHRVLITLSYMHNGSNDEKKNRKKIACLWQKRKVYSFISITSLSWINTKVFVEKRDEKWNLCRNTVTRKNQCDFFIQSDTLVRALTIIKLHWNVFAREYGFFSRFLFLYCGLSWIIFHNFFPTLVGITRAPPMAVVVFFFFCLQSVMLKIV